MMDKDDPRNEMKLARYSLITNRIRKICDFVYSISDELPWYLKVTKELTVSTTARTGINGDAIEKLAKKLIELEPIINELRDRSDTIKKNIRSANLN